MEACELVDHFIFSSDRYRILLLKLVQFIFFLKHIFDESSSAVSHFVESIVKSVLHRTIAVACLCLLQIWEVPDVVRDELLHAVNLNVLHKVFLDTGKSFDEA